MIYSLIVARSLNNVIGIDNKLPWHLKGDLQNFKKITMGHAMIMGRKTYQSIGRPLPGRVSVVLSKQDLKSDHPDLIYVHDWDEVEKNLKARKETEAFLIGGASLYHAFLEKVTKIYLTTVLSEVQGDAFFPPINFDRWEILEEKFYNADNDNDYDWSFQVLQRK